MLSIAKQKTKETKRGRTFRGRGTTTFALSQQRRPHWAQELRPFNRTSLVLLQLAVAHCEELLVAVLVAVLAATQPQAGNALEVLRLPAYAIAKRAAANIQQPAVSVAWRRSAQAEDAADVAEDAAGCGVCVCVCV